MVKVREIISELERAGWVQIRQTGSHRHCKHAMCVFRSFRTGDFGASSTGRRAPTAQQVAVAAQQRLTFTRKLLSDTYSAPHLMSLKSRDYQLGVVTDCSAEMPLSWISTWLKVRGFPSGLGHETAESAPCVEAVQID